ncbi:MAG: hypothetical protein A2Y81_05720 [Nitrospirae bacterium RBG_13_43_8]|nr:MAG: hypothetical protein A2Y81_05720 [Nitrospirae bacterium RBG_13_43_8]
MPSEDDKIIRVEEKYDKKTKRLLGYTLYTIDHPSGQFIHDDCVRRRVIDNGMERREVFPEDVLKGYQLRLVQYAQKNPHLLPGLLCVMLFLLPQLAPFKIQFMHDMFLEKIKLVASSRLS